MKIMMLTNDTTFAYNLRREVLATLAEQGHEVCLVGKILNFQPELEALGCRIIEIEMQRRGTNPLSDIHLFSSYMKIMRQEKPDIVFNNNIKPCIYGGLACKFLKIPYIPNITGLGTAVEIPNRVQKLTIWLYRLGVSGAKALMFQNQENIDFFRDRNMINKRSEVLLLPGSGVNLESHPLLPFPAEDKYHFLFVARILQVKGIDQYIAAAKALRAERDDVVFHVCGGIDDPAYGPVLAKLHEEGVIVYHGLQRDIVPFYEQATCLVHPTFYPEGMSNVLLEACASGRPIISTDRSGCREIVDDGINGFMIPVKDDQAVIDAIRKLLAMSREERIAMGLAGRAKVEREFDRKIVVQFYLDEIAKMEAAKV